MERGKVTNTRGSEGLGRRSRNRKDLGVVHFRFLIPLAKEKQGKLKYNINQKDAKKKAIKRRIA